VILGAREMIFFGGKEKVTSLPASSTNVRVAEKDIEVQRRVEIKRNVILRKQRLPRT
jgi:hypothetical protein